uniref:Uncharacterized protein n=1 Tax=Glossina brevipalpis TaxID=37001 RepID=A0A1A9WXS0_9MUSC
MDWIISDEMGLTVGHVVGWAAASAMVIGGVIPYVPQYLEIKKTQDAEGFSLHVNAVSIYFNEQRKQPESSIHYRPQKYHNPIYTLRDLDSCQMKSATFRPSGLKQVTHLIVASGSMTGKCVHILHTYANALRSRAM